MDKNLEKRLKKVLDELDAQDCIQYPSQAKTDIRSYNNYIEALKIIKTLPNRENIWTDDIHDYLFEHQITIQWKKDACGFVDFNESETKELMKLLHKCDRFTIDSGTNAWILKYTIYIPNKPNDD